MIVVIADDFTGAAEIAGIGLQYGLKVTVELELVKKIDTDLLIIATDTRSMSREDAYTTIKKLQKNLLLIDYKWLFKKTDSVFRGHILHEIKALLEVNLKKKVLLVTSNPALGRKIIDGKYYINDKPLNETEFANDPEYAIKSASVLELLNDADNDKSIQLLSPVSEISTDGIFLGEAGSLGDLKKLAKKVTSEILPAGASGFFAALLEVKGYIKKTIDSITIPNGEKKSLIVQGSAYRKNKIESENLLQKNIYSSYMPDDVFNNSSNYQVVLDEWCDEIINKYKKYNKILIGIIQPVVKDREVSMRLKKILAQLVDKVIEEIPIEELIIDGGATAYSIAKKLKYSKFFPMMQVAPGVIRMKVEENPNLCLTLKPGSYTMPGVIFSDSEGSKNVKNLK